MGLVVQASESDIDKLTPNNKYDKIFKEAISEVKDIDKIGPKLARRIQKLSENWVHEESPEYILKLLINYEKK
jgi:hypothetical protein